MKVGKLAKKSFRCMYVIDLMNIILFNNLIEESLPKNNILDLIIPLPGREVKFKLPPTKEFDMPYPEPFKLALRSECLAASSRCPFSFFFSYRGDCGNMAKIDKISCIKLMVS